MCVYSKKIQIIMIHKILWNTFCSKTFSYSHPEKNLMRCIYWCNIIWNDLPFEIVIFGFSIIQFAFKMNRKQCIFVIATMCKQKGHRNCWWVREVLKKFNRMTHHKYETTFASLKKQCPSIQCVHKIKINRPN